MSTMRRDSKFLALVHDPRIERELEDFEEES